MSKKIWGIISIILGLPLLGFSIYRFISHGLLLSAQFSAQTLVLIITALFGIFLGIVLIRGGLFLVNSDQFSASDVALQHLSKIYKKEDLASSAITIPNSSKYLKTKNIDLADIYQQIDPSKFPDTYNDLLATIKSRVEKA